MAAILYPSSISARLSAMISISNVCICIAPFQHVFEHLHLQPKDSHDVDFSRVRMWCLNGWFVVCLITWVLAVYALLAMCRFPWIAQLFLFFPVLLQVKILQTDSYIRQFGFSRNEFVVQQALLEYPLKQRNVSNNNDRNNNNNNRNRNSADRNSNNINNHYSGEH